MKYLPLFPLNLVVFPGEKLNLHIFEPRYKQLINDAVEQGFSFGIPAYQDGQGMDFGTEVELLKIVKIYPDGKMDVSTKGLRAFKILNYDSRMEGRMYPGGEVSFLENKQDADFFTTQKVINQIQRLYKIMSINKSLPENSAQFSVYNIAHKIGLSFDQEKMLLTTTSESDRQLLVNEHLNKMLPMVERAEEMRKKIQMNGHFKNVIPPKV